MMGLRSGQVTRDWVQIGHMTFLFLEISQFRMGGTS